MTATAPSKIVVEGLSKTYSGGSRTVHPLADVDLTISENEFVTLVGPSGCGKSTLLNVVAGLVEPTSGRVLVDGRPVTGPHPDRGVIFQQYALFPWLTVRANVEFALRLRGVDRRQRRAEAMHWLDLVHLADVAEALPKELSGGMKQRCAIARAYAAHPTVLLMDEPFGAVDALTRVRLQDQLLETWQREKRTVLFITHDVDEAVYLANRVVVMQADPGRIFRVIDVDLPHPRTEQLRLSEQFALLRNEVWRSVYHQREAAQPTP